MASIFNGRIEVNKVGPKGITALYGWTRNDGKTWHGGIDITCPDQPPNNTQVFAIRSGTVTQSKNVGEWGNYVTVLDHEGNYATYAHLNSRNVVQGQKVEAGQLLGIMGNTGNAVGGYKHVHFEERRTPTSSGINPCPFLNIQNKVGIYGNKPNETGKEQKVMAMSTSPIRMKIGKVSGGDAHTIRTELERLQIGYSENDDYIITTVAVSKTDQTTILTLVESLGNIGYTPYCDTVQSGGVSQDEYNHVKSELDRVETKNAIGLANAKNTVKELE